MSNSFRKACYLMLMVRIAQVYDRVFYQKVSNDHNFLKTLRKD